MDPSTYIMVMAVLMWVIMIYFKLDSITVDKTCIQHMVSPSMVEAVASSHSLECASEKVCETHEALLKRVLGQCMEPLRGSMTAEEFDTLVSTEWKKFLKVEYKPVSI
jgi:hypothetical protein